jgi:hypothetical protein
LPEVLKKLSEAKAPPQDSELALILSEMSKEGNPDNSIEMEVRQMANALKGYLEMKATVQPVIASPAKQGVAISKIASLPTVARNDGIMRDFNSKLQEFNTSRLSPQAFALHLKDLAQAFGLSAKAS